ncbi:hypothetical protein ABZ835_48010 [Streptomyces sp. NPDC047461]|uniref:hypothetical protein n=1 Tax=Streptomyces sp. NPDC047461 TaxID=3155619 RepID=UPI00340E0581
MDVATISSSVAVMAATGAVSGMGEDTALRVVERIRHRIRTIFGGDRRSLDSLDGALANPTDASQIQQLVSALIWYAERDEDFESELLEWAERYAPSESVSQFVRSGRDSYTAGRDMTVQLPSGAGHDEEE